MIRIGRFSPYNVAMNQLSPLTDKLLEIIQGIDLVASYPDHASSLNEMLAATRESIITVLGDFLKAKKLTEDKISVVDGFLFLFNDPIFAKWHTLNWWEQQKLILAFKDHQPYTERALALLTHSHLAPYLDFSDDMVARSTDQEVKRAWMRKRLVLKECFWNVIDSVSHAAYFQKNTSINIRLSVCYFVTLLTKMAEKQNWFWVSITEPALCIKKEAGSL